MNSEHLKEQAEAIVENYLKERGFTIEDFRAMDDANKIFVCHLAKLDIEHKARISKIERQSKWICFFLIAFVIICVFLPFLIAQ